MTTNAALYAMRLQHDNLVANYKAQRDEAEAMEAIRMAEKVRNAQNEYGALLEAHRRLPAGLQLSALDRMKELVELIRKAHAKAPLNFPRGPSPGTIPEIQETLRLPHRRMASPKATAKASSSGSTLDPFLRRG
jgi:hypothetical protein